MGVESASDSMIMQRTGVAKRCHACHQLYSIDEVHNCPSVTPASQQENINTLPSAERIPTDDLIGAIIGERYEIIEVLGRGGMGVVYKARHIVLHSFFAIKLLLSHDTEEEQQRFLREARLASKVRHPNIVQVADFGLFEDGRSYLVMECIDGQTLSSVIKSGALAPKRACRIALQIARGLQAVHDEGIIHRDLKPENIFLIGNAQDGDLVKIVDFGLARTIQTDSGDEPMRVNFPSADALKALSGSQISVNMTIPGTVMGTPAYMSPEQATAGEIDVRTDQYALGCILYQMLTASLPFLERSLQRLLARHIFAEPEPLRKRAPHLKVSGHLEDVIRRLMAKSREERFPAMRDVALALEQELEHKASWTQTVAPVALLAMVAGAGAYYVKRRNEPPQIGEFDLGSWPVRSRAWSEAALVHKDWRVRWSAALVLGRSESADAVPLLVKLLQDRERSVREAAAQALGQRTEAMAALALSLGLQDSESSVREYSLRALVRLSQIIPQQELRTGSDKLREALRHLLTKGTETEQMLASLIQPRLGDESQRSALHRMHASSNPHVRQLYVELFADAVDRLVSSLGDAVFSVRFAAAQRMAQLLDGRASPVLKEALAQSGATAMIAYGLLLRLGESVTEPPQIRDWLFQGELQKRLDAISALLLWPVQQAIPLLVRLARDPDVQVRQRVATVSAQLPVGPDGPAGLPVLRILVTDRDPGVRAHAGLLSKSLAERPPEAPEHIPIKMRTPEPLPVDNTSKLKPQQKKGVGRNDKKTVLTLPPTAAEPVDSDASSGADSRVDKLVSDALSAMEGKDSGSAQRSLEQARALCTKNRSAVCSRRAYDIYFRLGQIYEGQLRWVDAVKEYGRLQERPQSVALTAAQKSNVEASIGQVEPHVGRVILPKDIGGKCQEVRVWMPPGNHLVVVRGESQQVEVRAGQEVKVGSCK